MSEYQSNKNEDCVLSYIELKTQGTPFPQFLISARLIIDYWHKILINNGINVSNLENSIKV